MSRNILAAAIVIGALAAVASAGAGERARCSIMPFFGARPSQTTVLLGTASPDTVEAGPGSVTSSGHGGHFGRGGTGAIYGQVVDVARFGGTDSLALARAFALHGRARVVIVPWDYDGSCAPTRWSEGAAWVPIAEPGAFTVLLRPDSMWVEGVPTFDAFMAAFQPYPQGPFYRRGYRGTDSLRSAPSLTVAEYFELQRILPTTDEIRDSPNSAWSAVLSWQTENPDVARKYPAARMIASLRSGIYSTRARRILHAIVPVVGGTYRFTFSLDDEPAREFYARTRSRPTTDWRGGNVPPPPIDPMQEPPRPDGYVMLASGALSPDSLSVDCTTDRMINREGYINVLEPDPAGAATTEWKGKVEVGLLTNQFPADSALRHFELQEFAEWSRRRRVAPVRETPALFTIGDDGALRVEQTLRLEDGRTLTMRGERISNDVIACSW